VRKTICKQKEHLWERITEPLWPFRRVCKICGAVGKLYDKRKLKILPIKNEKTT